MYMYQINKVNVSSVFKNLKSFYFYMKVLIEGFKNFGNRSYKNGIHIKGECLMTTYTSEMKKNFSFRRRCRYFKNYGASNPTANCK